MWEGKTVLVTGAASGIGREIARQTAAQGAHVLATDRPGSAIADVAPEVGAEAREVDVTDREALAGAMDALIERYGRLDYVFNNAGVAIFGEVETVSLDEWDQIIDVNLRGVAHGTTLAYERMLPNRSGHIVNTASFAGLSPVALQAHYTATKHGVVGLSKALHIEARRNGIAVTAFCPAFVESGMFDDNTMHGSLDGSDARRMVPIKPLPTEKAVADLLRGVKRRRTLVITPFYAQLMWRVERFAPWLAERIHLITLRETRRRAKRSRG